MKPIVQAILGCAMSALLFVCGFWFGANAEKNLTLNHQLSGPVQLTHSGDLAYPIDVSLTHDGIPSDKVECMDWVSDHFDKVTAGMLGMICEGG